MSDEKVCGTCKWWEEDDDRDGNGECILAALRVQSGAELIPLPLISAATNCCDLKGWEDRKADEQDENPGREALHLAATITAENPIGKDSSCIHCGGLTGGHKPRCKWEWARSITTKAARAYANLPKDGGR